MIVGELPTIARRVRVQELIHPSGALLQATAYSIAHMVVARVVSGFGMGFINSSVPVLQAEFSPKTSRGVYACAQVSTLNFGRIHTLSSLTDKDSDCLADILQKAS